MSEGLEVYYPKCPLCREGFWEETQRSELICSNCKYGVNKNYFKLWQLLSNEMWHQQFRFLYTEPDKERRRRLGVQFNIHYWRLSGEIYPVYSIDEIKEGIYFIQELAFKNFNR